MSDDATYTGLTDHPALEAEDPDVLACLPCARSVVRELTWPNVPTSDAQRAAFARAVTAAARADAQSGSTHGIEAGGGFTIGSFSVSGAGESSSGALALMRSAATRELAGSGLLYLGLGALA